MGKVLERIEKLITEGYCDSRGASACASIISLPGWESKFRIVLMCVKDEYLNFYETDIRNNIGNRVASVEISKAENFVFKANLWTQVLAFDYEGQHYEFTNFGNQKIFKQVFEEERSK